MSEPLACPIPHPVLPPVAQLDPETQALVDRIGHHAFYSQFGHAPEIIRGWLAWYQPLMTKGRIETRTKELCRLRVAALNGCHY
jgi:alkylhydroperoxidase family enzyme